MRNLKRALSLALASVMLLGMMVVGSSAAFADADEIVNKEAVEITAGLGLFAGSDGKFDPKGTVTRAQMAAVISKMFYGSDLNADTYKGGGKFTDTVSFEGGWAEGYINLGVEKGWFKGYGDGTFGPGNAVTTAEAVTMLINLLGVDAGAGTWPMTVMAAAEDIELFDMEGGCELKPAPATNVALTRDQLAVMVWNALNYSAEGTKGYSVAGSKIVFDSWADAAAYADKAITAENEDGDLVPAWGPEAIQPVKNDTLAETVFEISKAAGVYVVGNQATGLEYTELSDGTKLNLETGLDMLGHYVTGYYVDQFKNEKNPGEAYCLVELAEYVVVAEDIDAKKEYTAAFGTTKVEADGILVWDFDAATDDEYTVTYDEDAYTATAATYVIDIETGKIIAAIAPISYTVETVGRVTTTPGKESIRIGTTLYKNNEDDDVIVEYDGIAEDDIVVVKNVAGVTYVEKLTATADQKVTKTATKDGKDYAYLNGTAYELAGVSFNVDGMVATADASSEFTYDAYIYDGKLIGLVETAGAASLSDAIFVVSNYKATTAGVYGTDTDSYYAQGFNAAGEEVSILIGVDTYGDYSESIAPGFYTFKKATEKEAAKREIMVATPAKDVYAFDADTDKFFQDNEVYTIKADTLAKDDKYVTIEEGRVFLTANTKFVVVEDNGETTDELEIKTYTGAINKAIGEGDLYLAASVDENENMIAEMIVIVAESISLKAEDYIFVMDGFDFSAVEDGKEYTVFFTSTNEFKTIVTDFEYATGFYGNYEINEDGIYELGAAEADDCGFIFAGETFSGIFGESSIMSDNIDLYDAANAFVVDLRDEDTLEESNVAEFETLKDIVAANKAEYKVIFTAIIDNEDINNIKVTHIFVTSVLVEDAETGLWVEA